MKSGKVWITACLTAGLIAPFASALECPEDNYTPPPTDQTNPAIILCDQLTIYPRFASTNGSSTETNEIDASIAIPACRKAAVIAPNNSRIQFQLGRALARGEQTKEAMTWIRKSAAQNYPPALAKMGHSYMYWRGVPKNQDKGRDYLDRAACAGDHFALASLAYIYQYGIGDVKKDVKKAIEFYIQAADKGNPYYQYKLGTMLVKGIEVPQDVNKGLDLILRSAEQGYSEAQLQYGFLNGAGYYGIPKNKRISNIWYEKAAAQGDSSSKGNLAQNYRNGAGVSKNAEKSAFWGRHAAYHGSGWGLYKVADLYRLGFGLEKDTAKAEQLYLKAADIYQKDSDNDFATSSYWLGTLYENGYGVARDRDKAITLYKKAALGHSEHAKKKLNRLGIEIPTNERE